MWAVWELQKWEGRNLGTTNLESIPSAMNALFNSLARAELGAAEQCQIISKIFAEKGNLQSANAYQEFAKEEQGHFEVAKNLCSSQLELENGAKKVYDGKFFSKTPSLLERLVIIHLVFEPSALAFLGYITRNADKLLLDTAWAIKARNLLIPVINEEVKHIYQSRGMIEAFWAKATIAEKTAIRKSVRRHRAFLKIGLASFFKNLNAIEYKYIKPHLTKMLEQFDQMFAIHTQELIYGTKYH